MRALETKVLAGLLVMNFSVVVLTWSIRDTWLGWEYQSPLSSSLLIVAWIGLLLSVPGLLAIVLMQSPRQKRKKAYQSVVHAVILLNVIVLGSMANWCIARYHNAIFITDHLATRIGFQPVFLPIVFSINTKGEISIEGSTSIVTEVGTITFSEELSTSPGQLLLPGQLATNPPLPIEEGGLWVIIKHRQDGAMIANAYHIQANQDDVFIATYGFTNTNITHNMVFVDASDGNIERVQINISG